MKIIAAITAAVVAVTTSASNIASQFENFYFVNDYEEPIENCVYCAVDATTASLGEIIELKKVPFNGENCAEIFVSLIEGEGLIPVYSGTTDEWFYLSAIEGIDTSSVSVPEDLKAFLTENGVAYTESVYTFGVLSEFDLTDTSGWIFTVNGEIPSVGMCDYVPKEGDEIKLCFTLYYGEDLVN